MALINCPECGHQMSDTAKKCPNCGYSNNKFKLDTAKPYILGGVIGLVGLFITILSFPVMSGWGGSIDPISSEFYVGCAMFLCGLIVMFIGCKKLRTYLNRSMLLFSGLAILCVASLIVFFLSVGFDHWEPYIPDTRMEQTASEDNATQLSNSIENDFIGTYVYNQPDNSGRAEKLIITLNDDETAIAKATVRGEEKTFYGSWSRFVGNNIKLTFSDAYFTWNGRTTSLLDAWIDWGEAINVDGSVIRDGYLYANEDMAKAKNPENRVKLEKQSNIHK